MKRKSTFSPEHGEKVFVSIDLRHLVDSNCELALLVSSCVLVNDIALNSLINNYNCGLVSLHSNCLVAAFNCCVELLDDSLHLALEHLVSKSLCSSNFYTLLCTFNIRHLSVLLIKIKASL